MNNLPLVRDFQNQVNSHLNPFSFSSDLSQIQITRLTSDHVKSDNHFDLQPVERSLSFFEMALSPFDTATSTSNSPKGTPTKSSSTRNMKSSVQKKLIKKTRGSDKQSKTKPWSKGRKATTTQSAQDDETIGCVPTGQEMKAYGKIREEHAEFPSKNSTFDEKEMSLSSPCTTMVGEAEAKTGNIKASERSVCFLNKVNTEATHMNFSGLNVFIEDDDDEDSFSFSRTQKTVKFVV